MQRYAAAIFGTVQVKLMNTADFYLKSDQYTIILKQSCINQVNEWLWDWFYIVDKVDNWAVF